MARSIREAVAVGASPRWKTSRGLRARPFSPGCRRLEAEYGIPIGLALISLMAGSVVMRVMIKRALR